MEIKLQPDSAISDIIKENFRKQKLPNTGSLIPHITAEAEGSGEGTGTQGKCLQALHDTVRSWYRYQER
jgi:hypothetical protein